MKFWTKPTNNLAFYDFNPDIWWGESLVLYYIWVGKTYRVACWRLGCIMNKSYFNLSKFEMLRLIYSFSVFQLQRKLLHGQRSCPLPPAGWQRPGTEDPHTPQTCRYQHTHIDHSILVGTLYWLTDLLP